MNDRQKIGELRQRLLSWGRKNLRDFPWRRTSDPYSLLVAEFMLHRTQVVQALPVYNCFLSSFPDIETCIRSNTGDIKKILLPLGLKWRIDGMVEALFQLWKRFKEVPPDYESLVSIPGIGPYIASATVCFSLNWPFGLVDTNTVRVTGRIFDMKIDSGARRRKNMIQKIKNTCDPENPRIYYYSMIDLAHLLCHPSQPLCTDCPLLNVPCTYSQKTIPSGKE